MAITDELREYARGCAGGMGGDALRHIADRIDREHRMALEKVAAEVDALPMTDESMAEHGWIRLPVDADGVPIRVGDVLNPPAGCDDYTPLQVVRLTYDGYENEWFFDGEAGGFCGMVGKHMDVAGWTHHHAPTVEDVLLEFADRVCNSGHQWGLDAADTIAEYAAKLRLAEEVDE